MRNSELNVNCLPQTVRDHSLLNFLKEWNTNLCQENCSISHHHRSSVLNGGKIQSKWSLVNSRDSRFFASSNASEFLYDLFCKNYAQQKVSIYLSLSLLSKTKQWTEINAKQFIPIVCNVFVLKIVVYFSSFDSRTIHFSSNLP